MALRRAADWGVARTTDADTEAMLAAVTFRVDVARENAGVRICPVGEVDMATIGHLRARIDEELRSGVERLILDLRQVTFLDSAGLHLVVDLDARAARNGMQFAIIAGPPAVQRTFAIAGLGARLPFVEVPRAHSARAAATGQPRRL
jgi:anti-sigma B factor antagonist